ncbi:calcitonin receptor [Trichonephila clavipes]|nr:calcitonin receptor [Trichonephila clavipes]
MPKTELYKGYVLCVRQALGPLEAWTPPQCGGDAYCEAVWDSVLCWPAIPAGQTAWRSCRQVLQYAAIPDVKNVVLPLEAKAYRVCNENGVWLWGNWTNYDACVNFTTPGVPKAPLTVSLILLVCSLISLFFLAVTIFIFFYFKTSVVNVELNPSIQQNASSNDNFRTTIMVSFRDVSEMKPYIDLSPNELALKIACDTEITLFRKGHDSIEGLFNFCPPYTTQKGCEGPLGPHFENENK